MRMRLTLRPLCTSEARKRYHIRTRPSRLLVRSPRLPRILQFRRLLRQRTPSRALLLQTGKRWWKPIGSWTSTSGQLSWHSTRWYRTFRLQFRRSRQKVTPMSTLLSDPKKEDASMVPLLPTVHPVSGLHGTSSRVLGRYTAESGRHVSTEEHTA